MSSPVVTDVKLAAEYGVQVCAMYDNSKDPSWDNLPTQHVRVETPGENRRPLLLVILNTPDSKIAQHLRVEIQYYTEQMVHRHMMPDFARTVIFVNDGFFHTGATNIKTPSPKLSSIKSTTKF